MNRVRNPFSAGRWVVGEHFFGRQRLIDSIIQSSESCDWIIGQRRVGKTSLLRQLEWLLNHAGTGSFGLFWDIQGSFDAKGLSESLIDAIEDSRDEFPDTWVRIDIKEVDDLPSTTLLKQLARAVSNAGLTLVLLIDEAEEFMSVGQTDPKVLAKLRKFFQNSRQVHTVLTSTPKLEQFHKTVSVQTSPLLHGFHARYLGPFNKDETHSLLAAGIDSEEERDKIFANTGGHPFETQLLGKHYFENPNLNEVSLELEVNPSLIQVLEVNFDLLSQEEQDILKDVFCGKTDKALFETNTEVAMVGKLHQMGYLRLNRSGDISVGSYFLRRWLDTKFDTVPTFHPQHASDSTLNRGHGVLLCRQIVTIYKYFLETAQDGKMPQSNDPSHFRVSSFDNTIYPNKDNPQFIARTEDSGDPWISAIKSTVQLIEQILDPKESWPLYRLCEMAADDFSKYSETDFLDMMLLIGEEAALT